MIISEWRFFIILYKLHKALVCVDFNWFGKELPKSFQQIRLNQERSSHSIMMDATYFKKMFSNFLPKFKRNFWSVLFCEKFSCALNLFELRVQVREKIKINSVTAGWLIHCVVENMIFQVQRPKYFTEYLPGWWILD